MARTAFISDNLVEAFAIYRMLATSTCLVHSQESRDLVKDFETLVQMVVGVIDPFDLDTRSLDHDLLEVFWDTVERIREEQLYRKLVRGALSNIRIINHNGLVLVDYQEFHRHN